MELLKGILGNNYHMRILNIYKHKTSYIKHIFTSGIKRAAAKRRGHRGLRFPVIGLDDDLVALHQPLTDKLLKYLRRTHYWGFILPPEKETHGA